MRFIVDSDILSEPTKPAPQAAVVDWLAAHELELVVNPVVLGELEYGILKLRAGRRRTRLAEWFHKLAAQLDVLPIDAATATIWAKLLADLRRKGRAMLLSDSLIAATALQHGLTVATRNVRDYTHVSVKLVNPFTI